MMKKLYISLFLLLLASCSENNRPQEIWIKNTDNESIYLQLSGNKDTDSPHLAIIQHGLASNMEHPLNAELKQLYDKYSRTGAGFEVYQVAIDTSKPIWINAVQSQALPWISVSDLRGQASPAVGLYNITKLPTNFLIDREGTVVARDIYGKSLEQKLDELTRSGK